MISPFLKEYKPKTFLAKLAKFAKKDA